MESSETSLTFTQSNQSSSSPVLAIVGERDSSQSKTSREGSVSSSSASRTRTRSTNRRSRPPLSRELSRNMKAMPVEDLRPVPMDEGRSESSQFLHQENTRIEDQRTLNLQQNVHQLNLTADVGIMNEAASAVVRAREDAVKAVADTRMEATKAVTEAKAETASIFHQAKTEVAALQEELARSKQREQSLQSEVLAMREEMKQLQSSLFQTQAQVSKPSPERSSPNGSDLLLPRMVALEEKVKLVEDQLVQHQGFLQELWFQPSASSKEKRNLAHAEPVHLEESQANPRTEPGMHTSTARNSQSLHSYPGPVSPPKTPVHFHLQNDDPETDEEDKQDYVFPEEDHTLDIEKRCLRTKEIHHLRLPALPETAAQYRTWRNAVRTMILAYDQSAEGYLSPWLSKAFTARGQESHDLAKDSGHFPRFDRVIASLLCRQESLKSSFGLKVQSYVERCEITGECIRGRFILNLIASEYDTAHAVTSITTSLELFQLPSPHDTVAGLKLWCDKVTYILSQLSIHDRPSDSMLSHWAYGSLKRHHLLRRVIDRYVESPAFQTFEYLWEGVAQALKESQHDVNAQSIRDDLRKGPSSTGKKMQQDTKALPAPKAKGKDGKAKGKGKDGGKPSSTDPKDRDDKSKSKKEKGGKGKGNFNKDFSKASASSQGSSSDNKCIFFARGKCTRANCPFSHDVSTAASAAAVPPSSSAAPKASAKAKAAVAMVAILSGIGNAMGQSSVLGMSANSDASFPNGIIEFIGDTGAGECLGSPEAFAKQGLNLPSDFFVDTNRPLRFSTGGGAQCGSETVGVWTPMFGHQNVYMLPQCPLALSIGRLCANGFSFVWPPNGIPFLVPPASTLTYAVEGPQVDAHRIDHHVPIFRFSADFVPGVPGKPSGGGG